MKVTIRWNPRISESALSKICSRFNIEYHPTINGLATFEIDDKEMELFRLTSTYGHFSICKS